jgi:hypothetical protein
MKYQCSPQPFAKVGRMCRFLTPCSMRQKKNVKKVFENFLMEKVVAGQEINNGTPRLLLW